MKFLGSNALSLILLSARLFSVSLAATDLYCEKVISEVKIRQANTRAWKLADFELQDSKFQKNECSPQKALWAVQRDKEEICSNASPIGCYEASPNNFSKWFIVDGVKDLYVKDGKTTGKITKVVMWTCDEPYKRTYPKDLKCNADGHDELVVACCRAPTVWSVDDAGKLNFIKTTAMPDIDVPKSAGEVTHINTDYGKYLSHTEL